MKPENKPILFFDGSCSLCRKEIAFYRKLDKENRVIWCDISVDTSLLDFHLIEFAQAMAELHGIDQKGRTLKGVEAFLLVWHELPYFRPLAAFVRFLRLTPLLEFFYQRFAVWRLQKQQCSITAKRKPITTDDQ